RPDSDSKLRSHRIASYVCWETRSIACSEEAAQFTEILREAKLSLTSSRMLSSSSTTRIRFPVSGAHSGTGDAARMTAGESVSITTTACVQTGSNTVKTEPPSGNDCAEMSPL